MRWLMSQPPALPGHSEAQTALRPLRMVLTGFLPHDPTTADRSRAYCRCLHNALGFSPEMPSYKGLTASSAIASAAARGESRKRDTRCELLLRRALWKKGFRYRVAVAALPGSPDIVFWRERVVVFCDGDFWHGRNLEQRIAKLATGNNAPYWVGKVSANVARDRRQESALTAAGWHVVRLWETDILRDVERAVARVASELVRFGGSSRTSKMRTAP